MLIIYCRGVEESENKIKTGRDVPRRFSSSVSWEDGVMAASNKLFKGTSHVHVHYFMQIHVHVIMHVLVI